MSLNWRPEWVQTFESPWSIFEKIKYANRINTRNLLQIYGTEESNKIKTGKVSNRYRELFRLDGFNHELLEGSLGMSVKNHTDENVHKITNILPNYFKMNELFRANLTYCMQCLNASGYHSFLHQFVLFKECPFHLCKLEEVCFHCGLAIPYMLASHELDHGFLCNCGESLITETMGYNGFSARWTEFPAVKNDLVVRWFHLNERDKVRIKHTYFLKHFIKNNPNALEHILLSSDSNNSNALFFDNKKNNYDSNVNIYDEIYNNVRTHLKAFEAYLMRTILAQHKHCIKRFSGLYKRREEPFPPICPYAYAYIFWKETFYNINPFYNDFAPLRRSNLKNLEFPFYIHSELVKEMLLVILKDTSIGTDPSNQIFGHINSRDLSKQIKSINWILGHLVWNLANNHFIEWLQISSENSSKNMRPLTKYNEFKSSNSIFSFVRNDYVSSIEFHRLSNNDSELKLICPYSHKMLKTIAQDEISHLPIRLSMTPGFEEEKKVTEKYLAGLKLFSVVK